MKRDVGVEKERVARAESHEGDADFGAGYRGDALADALGERVGTCGRGGDDEREDDHDVRI
jgi:hypothetical protein